MRNRHAVALVVGALCSLPATAGAVGDGGEGSGGSPMPYFDSRAEAPARKSGRRPDSPGASGSVTAPRTPGRQALGDLGPEAAALTIDPLTGTPRQLVRTDGPLAGPRDGGASRSRPSTCAPTAPCSASTPPTSRGSRSTSALSTPNGLTVVRFRQLFDGIPAFDNDVRVALDDAGRVYSVAGSPLHDPARRLDRAGAVGRRRARRAARNVGAAHTPAPALRARRRPPGDGVRRRRLRPPGDLRGGRRARLAWHVTLHDAAPSTTRWSTRPRGAILYRQNLVKDVANAAGVREPSRRRPRRRRRSRGLRPRPGRHHADRLLGAAWSDIDDDDVADPAEEIAPSAGSDFLYPFTRVHPGPELPGRGPVRLEPGGAHLVADEPLAERRPGVLPRLALPRPPRRPGGQLHRRSGATSRSAAPAAATRCSSSPTTAPRSEPAAGPTRPIPTTPTCRPRPTASRRGCRCTCSRTAARRPRSTSATSTAATTRGSSGTSTRTASPIAWSPTPTGRAR